MGQTKRNKNEGRVRVEVGDQPDDVSKQLFGQFGPGAMFGEIALVDPGPRTADIVAEEDITYLELDWDGIDRIRRILLPSALTFIATWLTSWDNGLKETTRKMLV